MTKLHPLPADAWTPGSKHAPEDEERNGAGLAESLFSFPGSQRFDEIMREKMRPAKVAKFRNSRIPEKNS